MATIYRYMKPEARAIDYPGRRISEIDEQISQLTLEREMMVDIRNLYSALVCRMCAGQGHIMKPVEGCECDGPRMHPCPACSSGKTK